MSPMNSESDEMLNSMRCKSNRFIVQFQNENFVVEIVFQFGV